MKSRSPLITLAIALTGVILIALGMMALGQHESESFPSAHSYLPSGTAAMEELFRRSGYQVVVDQRATPKLQPGDLAVAFFVVDAKSVLSEIQEQGSDGEGPADPLQPTKDALTDFVKGGGSLLSLPVTNNFADNSRDFLNGVVTVHSSTGKTAQVNWDRNPSQDTFIPDQGENFGLWSIDPKLKQSPELVSLHRVGKGSDAVVADGIIASNRFIDRNQNALVLMDTVRVLAKPGARVVFVEAAFGNAEDPALTDLIGPWAKAAWLQLVFLGIVAVYTLGKPFGLPIRCGESKREPASCSTLWLILCGAGG